MALKLLKKLSSSPLPYLAIAGLLLALIYLLSAATQDSSSLNDLFLIIFAVGLLTLSLLAIILFRSLFKLYSDFKHHEPGSRLTTRLVTLFVLLILISSTIIYSFSIHFLHRGINSWFDVEIERALDEALELSQTAFDIRIRSLLRQTRMMAGTLAELPESEISYSMRELSQLSGAEEISIWTMDGQLITSSIQNPTIIVPDKPNAAIFRQLQQREDYISLDPDQDDRLQLRAAVNIPSITLQSEQRILHVLFPVSEKLSSLGKTVQDAYTDYKELNYLRKPLINIFTLTLSLIVLLTVLASIWFTIWISKRIVHPLQELADGTQSVASGNYNTKLNTTAHDEIGFLVQSFNQMTHRLTQARDATQTSHRLLEQQTHYLTTVLGSLSSGVLTINANGVIKTANVASNNILGISLMLFIEKNIKELAISHPHLQSFTQMILDGITNGKDWQQQLELLPQKRHQTLICRGTQLTNDAGWVVVFDDITALIQAQRDAAWGEVARRLAHEIKNPLTPIQLSAERLQHKYIPLLPDEHAGSLEKLTGTIIQQVSAMKDMVNDFSDYAKTTQLDFQRQPLHDLIVDVCMLYQGYRQHQINITSSLRHLDVDIDSTRFRQVLHNLIKNAIESSEEAQLPVKIEISYEIIQHNSDDWLELRVRDYGPGIPNVMINKLFEPYATSKTKGTGLGLAIVKKIMDEHQGLIWAENIHPNGACIIIQLPLVRHES